MDDRWALVLSRLRERFPVDANPADVEAFLRSEGYSRRDIVEIVLAWTQLFHEPDLSQPGALTMSGSAFRVMGPHEQGRFTTEAWGYLLSLAHGGVVNPADLEGVIDRALAQVEGRITLDDLRSLMESGGLDEFGPPPDHVTIH
jgi:uncharacterized protein Smg (DUF494 family)